MSQTFCTVLTLLALLLIFAVYLSVKDPGERLRQIQKETIIMDETTALNLAIECVNKEIRRLAVDANLAERFGATFPYAVRASKRRSQLRQALELLNTLTRPPG